MHTGVRLVLAVNITFGITCHSQSNTWHEASVHTVHFVAVEKNVQLEILDWGGNGRSIVLLAGGGNTAHVFDDFAPKLATRFHVYGITRRGFGASQYSPIENVDRLAKDILAVLDSMKIVKPVLVGHSIAGAELSAVANISQDRISALIYLEAGYPYAYDNGQSPPMRAFMELGGPQQPFPSKKDLTSFKDLQAWDLKTYGVQKPEAEFRQTWDSTAQGEPTHPRDSPGYAIFSTILNDPEKFDKLPLRSLVFFAIPHTREAWMTRSTDESIRKQADVYFSKIDSLATRQANSFEKGVASAKVLRLRGMHYIFLSNGPEVLNAIRQFLD